jgi:hypothetical protein
VYRNALVSQAVQRVSIRRIGTGTALAVLFVLVAAPAGATTARALGLEEHVALSAAVVEGRVGDAQTGRDPATGQPFTDTLVRVERVLHGAAPAAFRIRQMKGPGAQKGSTFVVVGDGELVAGERVVLFVKHDPDGRYYLTALAQSVYRVKGEGDGAKVERDLEGLVLLEPDAAGRWVSAPPEAGAATLTVRELRSKVLDASSRHGSRRGK